VRRVLIVQDDGTAAGSLEDVLIELGYDVPETTVSCETAIAQVRASPPDLVLILQDTRGRMRAEGALQESEELHRITLSNISDAVFITDDAGEFTYICPNVDVIFGYSFQEVERFGHIDSLLGGHLFAPAELEAALEIRNIERDILDKVGRKHTLLVNVKRVSIKGGTILYTCRDITERVRTEQELRRYKEHRSVEEAIAEERRRIAQEIHDGLIQNLAGLRFRSRHWHRLIETDPAQMHAELDQIQEIVSASIDEMRRSILALRPVVLDEQGFFPALRQLISDFCEHRQLCVDLQVSGPEVGLPSSCELTLFRIIQEALSNVDKHARASTVDIVLDLETVNVVVLTVRDDGQGFDPAALDQAAQHGHLGLRQMRERVENANGTVIVHSEPCRGTEIRVTLPLIERGNEI
jgi:PAS domain S-box-containing protein